jgi:hypothetical protein
VVTANALNGSTSVTLPDLSGITGFPAAPTSGTFESWSAQIDQDSTGFRPPFTQAVSGAQHSMVENSGSFTIP